MVERYRTGVVPSGAKDSPLERVARETLDAYARALDANELQQGAALIIELASRANRYVEETAPWKLAKEKRDAELDTVLADLVRTVARLAVLSAPYMPEKAAAIWSAVGTSPPRPFAAVRLGDIRALAVDGWRVAKTPPLFPKEGTI
jgi:methionyl-tRNA synthetase